MNLVINGDGDHSVLLWIEGIPMLVELYVLRSASWDGTTVPLIDVSFSAAYGMYSKVETKELLSPKGNGYFDLLGFNNPVAAIRAIRTVLQELYIVYTIYHSGSILLLTYEATSRKRDSIYKRMLKKLGMVDATVYDDAYTHEGVSVWVTPEEIGEVTRILNQDGVSRII